MNFNDIFKSSFLENVTSVSILDMVVALALAFCLGLFIFMIYKKTYTGVEPQEMLQLKVIKDHDQNLCWPTSGGNYTFDVNSLGDLTVTFDPATGEINVTGDGVIPPVYNISKITT